jgi:peptidoglycan/LPS O-acetylase OafA/YrhL
MALGLYYPIYSIDKFGDYSYGIYIFHYPLIQVFVYFGSFTVFGLFWGVLLWVFVLGLLAIFSWIFVEKPALQYSKSGFFTLG